MTTLRTRRLFSRHPVDRLAAHRLVPFRHVHQYSMMRYNAAVKSVLLSHRTDNHIEGDFIENDFFFAPKTHFPSITFSI